MDTNDRRNNFKIVSGGVKSLQEQKSQLRAYMKKQRTLVDNKDVKERLMIDQFFAALKAQGKAQANTFFVYMSYSSEARTDGLIAALKEQGKQVYAPCVDGEQMQAVLIGEDFSLSDMGIREPVGQPFDGEVDVVVLPLLAVDEKGNRLGYGGGYYDRYLQKHPTSYTVGFAYDCQVVKSVPHEATDIPLCAIVTDKRIIYTK